MARRNSNSRSRSKLDPKDLEAIEEGKKRFPQKGKGRTFISKENDVSWYALNDQLLKDSASYPYTYPLGNPIDYGPAGLEANNWSIPGIMTIEVSPTPGYAVDPIAPINIAARKQFSDIRKANSGSANYHAPDLMEYYMAVDSAYMMLSFFKRAYGVIMTYNPVSRYAPKAFVESMGLDFNDIASNLSDFRAMVNTYIVKISSMSVPRDMSYMAKHRWMFEGLYKDQDINKAQIYMFIPHGYYIFDLDSDGAGMLRWQRYMPFHDQIAPQHKLTVSDIDALLASIINPILYGPGTQDFNIMSGDILKAYGPENCITMEQIPTEYGIVPTYSEEVLDQIQNATLLGTIPMTSASIMRGYSQDITQDPTKDFLHYDPKFYNFVPLTTQGVARPSSVTTVAGDNCFVTNRIVTFDRDVVLPEHTMVATRLSNIACDVELVPDQYAQFYHCKTMGSEVANRAIMWRYEVGSDGSMVLKAWRPFNMSWTFLNIIPDMSASIISRAQDIVDVYDELHQMINEISYFHRHMAVAVTAGMIDESTAKWYFDSFNGYCFDVNSYTVLVEQDLKQMSETALLSEFDITIK